VGEDEREGAGVDDNHWYSFEFAGVGDDCADVHDDGGEDGLETDFHRLTEIQRC